MKLIKLNENHYIIADDSEIEYGDYYISPSKIVVFQYSEGTQHNGINQVPDGCKKITHSTQPESLGIGWMQSVQPLLISEVKELIGEVDNIECEVEFVEGKLKLL